MRSNSEVRSARSQRIESVICNFWNGQNSQLIKKKVYIFHTGPLTLSKRHRGAAEADELLTRILG